MSDEVMVAILAVSAQAASAAETGLEAKFRAAFKAAKAENWMAASDDAVCRAGIMGVLQDIGEGSPDFQRILDSTDALRKSLAWLHAVQAGVEAEPPEIPEDGLPIMKWYKEAKP